MTDLDNIKQRVLFCLGAAGVSKPPSGNPNDGHWQCHAAMSEIRQSLDELRELRAWKERLGDPASWFPSIAEEPSRFSPYELRRDCRALLERAKETP